MHRPKESPKSNMPENDVEIIYHNRNSLYNHIKNKFIDHLSHIIELTHIFLKRKYIREVYTGHCMKMYLRS